MYVGQGGEKQSLQGLQEPFGISAKSFICMGVSPTQGFGVCPQGQDQWGGPHQPHSFPSLQVKILLCNPYLGGPPHLSVFRPAEGIGSFKIIFFSKLGCSFEDALGERYLDILSIGTL